MFSALYKVWEQLNGALHDLLDKTNNAGRAGRQAIRKVDQQIRDAEESVTDVDAELRLMQHEAEKAEKDALKLGQVARHAANAGDRQGAIEAVQRQVQAEELAGNYKANVQRLAPMLEQLQARLSQLRLKKQEMQHKTTLLDARSKVADAETRAARYLGDVGSVPGIRFDELERQVDRKEAKAAALADMAHAKAELNVDARLAGYARSAAIDEKLRALGIPAVEATPDGRPASVSKEIGHA